MTDTKELIARLKSSLSPNKLDADITDAFKSLTQQLAERDTELERLAHPAQEVKP